MFSLLSGMKWAHLPNAGGIYDQDPDLLDKFRYIFAEQAKEQEREHKKTEREAKRNTGRAGRVT